MNKQGESKHGVEFTYTPRFDICNISLTPFTSGVTTKDGIMFDLVNILPYIKKNGVHPILKTPLASKGRPVCVCVCVCVDLYVCMPPLHHCLCCAAHLFRALCVLHQIWSASRSSATQPGRLCAHAPSKC
jgi:hypothetical protein